MESQAGIANLELKTEEVTKWKDEALNKLNAKQKESVETQLKKKIESSNKALSEHQIHSLTNATRTSGLAIPFQSKSLHGQSENSTGSI